MLRLTLASLLLATAAAAHSYTHGGMKIAHPWTWPTQAGGNAAGYLKILGGEAGDRLIGATSPAAAQVEIHRVEMEGDVAKMRAQPEGFAVPAGGEFVMKPGGAHIMLIGIKETVPVGGSIPLVLRFEKAGELAVELKAEDAAEAGSAADAHKHH